MSAAFQLATVWGASSQQLPWREERRNWETRPAEKPKPKPAQIFNAKPKSAAEPSIGLAFYRKHTESMLRRYLYASMQVGRSPSILGDPVGRGWVSSRPIRTFEDAVIFVLDLEKCLDQLGSLDRQLLSRIVLQEYTQAEAATLIGMSVRAISYKFPQALDHLTEKLLASDLLVLPQ
jgi:hypothetical protein